MSAAGVVVALGLSGCPIGEVSSEYTPMSRVWLTNLSNVDVVVFWNHEGVRHEYKLSSGEGSYRYIPEETWCEGKMITVSRTNHELIALLFEQACNDETIVINPDLTVSIWNTDEYRAALEAENG